MSVKSSNTGTGYISPKKEDTLGDGLYPVHGIAIGEGDVTVGHLSEERKRWTAEALEGTGRYLVGKHIVVNHENKDAYKVIGEITKASYKPGVGIIYEGHIDDPEIWGKVKNGWLDVSVRVAHADNPEEDEDGTKIIENVIGYDNLSVVREGAAPSNTIRVGGHEELSVEELSALTDELQTDKEWREGDFVQWGSQGDRTARGEVIDWKESGEYSDRIDGDVSVEATEDDPAALIDVYQETDDGWTKGETTVAHKFSTLREWSPDSIVEENQGKYTEYMYDNREAAQGAAESLPCSIDFHKHDAGPDEEEVYMPCSSHKEFEKAVAEAEDEELQISTARTPEFDSTETKSWGDIPAGTLSYWTDALGFDAEQVDDLTEEQKGRIAQHTLLGDPQADNVRELRMFPVVNGNTRDLNRGALEAVRSGRGQSADIPQDTYESAFQKAGELLNDNFDTDVDEELTPASIYNATAESFGNSTTEELDVDQDELDEVYSEWSDTVNMTASQLRTWSGNPCSREASIDPVAVIERNLELLETDKSDWTQSHIDDADRTISFINRMRGMRPDSPKDGSFGCPSEWAISLLNWAYNPFDSLPDQPDNEDLDDVEELSKSLAEVRIMPKHDYTDEEMEGVAEMMSSMSEMTMDEMMELMNCMGPGEPRKLEPVAKLAASSLGADMDEMKSYMEMAMDRDEMGVHGEEMSESESSEEDVELDELSHLEQIAN